jgi:hypothetical protein
MREMRLVYQRITCGIQQSDNATARPKTLWRRSNKKLECEVQRNEPISEVCKIGGRIKECKLLLHRSGEYGREILRWSMSEVPVMLLSRVQLRPFLVFNSDNKR